MGANQVPSLLKTSLTWLLCSLQIKYSRVMQYLSLAFLQRHLGVGEAASGVARQGIPEEEMDAAKQGGVKQHRALSNRKGQEQEVERKKQQDMSLEEAGRGKAIGF